MAVSLERNQSSAQIIIAGLILVGVFSLVAAVLFLGIPDREIQIVDVMIGALGTGVAVIIKHFFPGGK